jgi:hypothetical protein
MHEPDIENQCSSHRGLNLLAHEPDIENQCSSHRGLNLLAHEPDIETDVLVKGFRPLGARARREDQCPSQETPVSWCTGLD